MKLKRTNKRAGYTLMEVIVSASIASVLLLGGVDLFLSAVRVSTRVDAQVSATTRASVTVAQIIDMSRECSAVALPTDAAGFNQYFDWHSPADYITADGRAACVQFTLPGPGAPTVNDANGSPQTAGAGFAATYSNTALAGQTFWLYRSDANGNPRPNDGQYIWVYGPMPGYPASAYVSQKFAKIGETAAVSAGIPDEVTFARPATSDPSLPAVEIHLIAADYSAIRGSQGSEGATNQVVGKCVMLRNHS